MRVFSHRWMAVTLVLPLPASRWPLPPSLSPQGSPSLGNPRGPIPAYTHRMHVYACADVRSHNKTGSRAALIGAQHLGTERKQSLSRLNPGVSFPLRCSSYSRPPPSDFGHNADGVVIKFQISSASPCLVGRAMHGSTFNACLRNNRPAL